MHKSKHVGEAGQHSRVAVFIVNLQLKTCHPINKRVVSSMCRDGVSTGMQLVEEI